MQPKISAIPLDLQYPRHAWSLDRRNPETIAAMLPIWSWFYRYYFRVTSDGWEHVPTGQPFLAVGSHNGGLAAPDMYMLMCEWFQRYGIDQPIYGLMHPKVWEISPPIAQMAMEFGALVAHPRSARNALHQGFPVLVYPGGMEDVFRQHRWRHRINFAGRTGFIKLALREKVPIIPVVSAGAHDTLMVLGNIYEQIQSLGLPWPGGIDPLTLPVYLGFPWGIAVGPLPNIPAPVQVHNRICKPITFSYCGRDAANDKNYVWSCYQQVKKTMQQQLIELVRERQLKYLGN
jgi:1-acyl-sn-glycerol-3-phosphate acyltransferase